MYYYYTKVKIKTCGGPKTHLPTNYNVRAFFNLSKIVYTLIEFVLIKKHDTMRKQTFIGSHKLYRLLSGCDKTILFLVYKIIDLITMTQTKNNEKIINKYKNTERS